MPTKTDGNRTRPHPHRSETRSLGACGAMVSTISGLCEVEGIKPACNVRFGWVRAIMLGCWRPCDSLVGGFQGPEGPPRPPGSDSKRLIGHRKQLTA